MPSMPLSKMVPARLPTSDGANTGHIQAPAKAGVVPHLQSEQAQADMESTTRAEPLSDVHLAPQTHQPVAATHALDGLTPTSSFNVTGNAPSSLHVDVDVDNDWSDSERPPGVELDPSMSDAMDTT